MYIIYKILFPNEEFYIGLTKDLHQRKISHKTRAKCGPNTNLLLYNAINKYGFENLQWIILSEHSTLEEANKEEKIRIEIEKPKYNLANGGNVNRTTDSMKQKMSKSRIGKRLSKSSREKLSNSLKEFYKDKKCNKEKDSVKRERNGGIEATEKMRETIRKRKLAKITLLAESFHDGMSTKELADLTGLSLWTVIRYHDEWDEMYKTIRKQKEDNNGF